MSKVIKFALLLSLLAAAGCAPRQGQAIHRDSLVSLEYHLRWQRGDFKASWLPPLVPPAWAELPPQYQKAFSLYILFNHAGRQLEAEWHSQMVMDPATAKSARKFYGQGPYDRLVQTLEGKLACTTSVEQGWAGPSPKLLRITQRDSRLNLYVGGPQGPAGPDRELDENNERRYLCSPELEDQLQFFISDLKGHTSDE